MSKPKHNIKLVKVTTLLLLLFVPAGIQFAHSFENHNQKHCNEDKIHLHEAETLCELCDFHLHNLNIFFNIVEINHISVKKSSNHSFVSNPFYNKSGTYFNLRGPPTSSSLFI